MYDILTLIIPIGCPSQFRGKIEREEYYWFIQKTNDLWATKTKKICNNHTEKIEPLTPIMLNFHHSFSKLESIDTKHCLTREIKINVKKPVEEEATAS